MRDHLSALGSPFDGQYLLRLKKQIEDLSENYNRVNSEKEHERLFSHLTLWNKKLRSDYNAVSRFLRDSVMEDPTVKNAERQISAYYKKLAPWSSAIDDVYLPSWTTWNEDFTVRLDWKRKLLKAASELPDIAKWLDAQVKKKKVQITIPDDSERSMHLEGFDTALVGFDENDPEHVKALDLVREGLRMYKERATRVMPDLVRKKLPLVLRFDVQGLLGNAGQADSKSLDIYPLNIHSKAELVHTVSHEMAHHFAMDLISHSARAFWIAAIKGDWADLDLNDVLRAWPKGQAEWDWSQSLRGKDPILYLQIEALTSGHSGTLPKQLLENWSRESIEQYLAEGGNPKVRVPTNPITAYASFSPDEAFAEAVSMLITYGPRAVLPQVREWLRIALPGQFREGNHMNEPRIIARVVSRFASGLGSLRDDMNMLNRLLNAIPGPPDVITALETIHENVALALKNKPNADLAKAKKALKSLDGSDAEYFVPIEIKRYVLGL